MLEILTFIFIVGIMIMSIVAHEAAHGFAADALGDPTPRLQGRLSANPMRHLDIVGSLIVPLIAYFTSGFVFGWAKPVMINPYNFSNRKRDELIVALAGPAINIAIAILFAVAAQAVIFFSLPLPLFGQIAFTVAFTNLVLAFFNMIPVPPLDGSKILFTFLPEKYDFIRGYLESAGFIVIILLIGLISPIISGAAFWAAHLLF